MSLKQNLVLLLLSLCIFGAAKAAPIDPALENLKNDKEVEITTIKKKEVNAIRARYKDGKYLKLISSIFYENMQEYVDSRYNKCELRFVLTFRSKLRDQWLDDDQESVQDYLKLLRSFHHIDDLLYEILTGVNKDYFGLEELNVSKRPGKSILARKALLENNDLAELYSEFKEWPDEYDSCSYNNYIILKQNVRNKKGEISEKASELKHLNKKAFEAGVISLESYRKLEYLRTESNINERNIWLDDYLNIVFKAKNKMVPLSYSYTPMDIEKENKFSSEKLRRFSKVTRRKALYQKYDENQIIMLAQVLQRASRRMGVDPDTDTSAPIITQEFSTLLPSGERETYVERIELDPQSQYNLARRLLRKDMTELQMMDSFAKVKITHEDIVMAALETGYISLEDIEHVVKYDDLWNPSKKPWEKVVNFIFRIAGYSTFFLPPPWNVAASIAMGVAEGIVDNKLFFSGANNDNPATFIE